MANNQKRKIDLKAKYIRDGRAPIPKNESISRVMSANKGKNTSPEIKFRKALWAHNIKGYRLHSKHIPGRPDLSFTRKKLAVFINGCFWHRCPYCNLSLPKTNSAFWKNKFEKNEARDKKKIAELKDLGWKVLVVWECQINNNLDKQIKQIEKYN
jgi:DNA mismatch endonuclease, patch repair protein